MRIKFKTMVLFAMTIAVLACTLLALAFNASTAQAVGTVISKQVIENPKEAGGDMVATVISSNKPVVPDGAGNLVYASASQSRLAVTTYPEKQIWNTVYYTIRGTDHWVMWYTVGKSWTFSKKKHRVMTASILGHWGKVNALAQALGWSYKGDNLNASTFRNWDGYYHGQHFTRYIGRFEFKPVHIPIVTNTRTPNVCISVHYNGTYSFAGTKS